MALDSQLSASLRSVGRDKEPPTWAIYRTALHFFSDLYQHTRMSCNICSEHGGHFKLSREVRIAMSRDWLKSCLEEHASSGKCGWLDAHPPLPTRVLELDLGDGTRDIRLVEGKERTGKYAALTYRWGSDSENIFKTVSDNLLQNKSRITFKSLNMLFKDTVSLLRSLKILYLWIDRFCIVQDDKSDWESEASKMADVYSNAHLTISASVSTSPNARLFPHSSGYIRRLVPVEGDFDSDTVGGTLSRRGWCIQERCLSRRILHFGRAQMHWECPTSDRDEHWVSDLQPVTRTILGPRPFDLGQPNSSPYPSWYHIMHNYTAGSFTYERDRQSGLLGLQNVFKSVTGDRMIWGLWVRDLAFGLMWGLREYAVYPKREDKQSWHEWRPGTLGSPSWSWFSVVGGVSWPIYGSEAKVWGLPKERLVVQDLCLDEATNLITLRGKLFRMGHTLEDALSRCKGIEYTLFPIWDADPQTAGIASDIDGDGHATLLKDVWVLVVKAPRRHVFATGEGDGVGLLLIEEKDSRTYKRIGVAEIQTFGPLEDYEELWDSIDLSLIVLG